MADTRLKPANELAGRILADSADQVELIAPEQVRTDDAEQLREVGVFTDQKDRSGTFVMQDFHSVSAMSLVEGLELLPIHIALEKYDWLREDYFFKAVPADLNERTSYVAAQETPQGYFVRVAKGAEITLPCQTALYISKENIAQAVHNVVILEEGSSLKLITGCISHRKVPSGIHIAVSEMYIGANATLTSTMVHSWGKDVVVRPSAGIVVEDGGRYINNYISLRPGADIVSNPTTWLNGKDSSAKYQTIIMGSEGSRIETGGEVFLNGENSRAEMNHRGVCTGGIISQRGTLHGNAPCRAHVDCAGMLLDTRGGYIESVPGIKAHHPQAQMSHEASIGRIAPEQVEYLMARGMEDHEAISMIIRGFLDADIEGLGKELDARIADIARMAGHGEG
ncbi:MAG: SufD family Fe-S cluster assembly protein [Anaerolineales bacterium]|nr:SufD family Fe-S cluster assembly protein [Anaerolineales bacterium]